MTPQQKAAAADQLLALVAPPDPDPTKPDAIAAFLAAKASLRNKFVNLKVQGSPSAVERDHLSSDEFKVMNSQILTIRRYGGDSGPLTPEARAMLDRVTFDYFGGLSADRLQAAAIELANLAGMGSASKMLNPRTRLCQRLTFLPAQVMREILSPVEDRQMSCCCKFTA